MNYKGKLYGKVAGKYIEMTPTVEDMENRIKSLESAIETTITGMEWNAENEPLTFSKSDYEHLWIVTGKQSLLRLVLVVRYHLTHLMQELDM